LRYPETKDKKQITGLKAAATKRKISRAARLFFVDVRLSRRGERALGYKYLPR
jgi:hypothetical protein